MRLARVEIKAPRWEGNAKERVVGIAEYRMTEPNLQIDLTYTRKDGTRTYPDPFFIKTAKALKYPTQVVGGNVVLRLIPMKDLATSIGGIDEEANLEMLDEAFKVEPEKKIKQERLAL
jgi:hypothetical protein